MHGFIDQFPAENEACVAHADRAACAEGMSLGEWVAQSA